MTTLARLLAVSIALLALAGTVHAAPPATMSLQGYLTGSGGTPVSGNVSVVFRLYDAPSGGAALWTETQPAVAVANGIYNVTLGSVTPINLPFDTPYFLGVTVGADAEMTPRQPLASVGYAFRASQVDTVSASSIADASVTASKLAPSGCTNGQVLQYNGTAWACATVGGGGGGIADGSVTTAKLADGAVSTAKLADGAVTFAKIAPGGCSNGQVLKSNGAGWACAPDGPANALLQGGNAFGAPARIGSTDNQPVNILTNNLAVVRIRAGVNGVSLVAGYEGNTAPDMPATTIAGGGLPGTSDAYGSACGTSCANRVTEFGGSVGGGAANQAGDGGSTFDMPYSTVAGGFGNNAVSGYSAVGGGRGNTAGGNSSFVGGGGGNQATGTNATVAGGNTNSAGGAGSGVVGGSFNSAPGSHGNVAGGSSNFAGGSRAAIAGGEANNATGFASFVAGGSTNTASGNYSLAAGRRAATEASGGPAHDGAFVWSDSTDFTFRSSAANEFSARATGGVRFVTAIDGSGNPTATVSIDNTATVTAPGLRVATNGTKITRMQAGEVLLGPGVGGVNMYTVMFPAPFATQPKVTVTPRTDFFNGNPVSDMFVATIRQLSTTNFQVNVYRVDIAGGSWAVNLWLDWMAWE